MTDTASREPAYGHQVGEPGVGYYPWTSVPGATPDTWGPTPAPQPAPVRNPLAAVREHAHPELNDLLDRLLALEHGRQSLLDHLWATVPSYVNEDANNVANTAVTTLTWPPKNAQLVKVLAVIVSIGTGQTGTLTLGDWVLPCPAGVTAIPGDGVALLYPSGSGSTRQLVLTGAVPASVHVFGELLPTLGTMH